MLAAGVRTKKLREFFANSRRHGTDRAAPTLMPSQIGANLQVAAYSSEIAETQWSNTTHSKPFGDPSLLSQFRENQPAEESKPELAFSIPDRVHCLL